jgi:hypothetical protein
MAVDELVSISVFCWEASFIHKLLIIRIATTTATTSKLYFALMCIHSIVNSWFSTSPALALYGKGLGIVIIVAGTLMLVVISRNTCNWITFRERENNMRCSKFLDVSVVSHIGI